MRCISFAFIHSPAESHDCSSKLFCTFYIQYARARAHTCAKRVNVPIKNVNISKLHIRYLPLNFIHFCYTLNRIPLLIPFSKQSRKIFVSLLKFMKCKPNVLFSLYPEIPGNLYCIWLRFCTYVYQVTRAHSILDWIVCILTHTLTFSQFWFEM